jgi:excisionase family DNA binding protein
MELNDGLIDDLAQAIAERVEACLTGRGSGRGYLDVQGAAEYLSCPRSRIYDLTSRRQLPHYKLGSRLLFSKQGIDAWLDETKVEAEPRQPRGHRGVERLSTSVTGRRQAAPTTRGSLRALLKEEAKPEKPERHLPPPLSFDEKEKEMTARALGMSRAEFDPLMPHEFERLWDERFARFEALSEEQQSALFDWDPDLEKLAEMPISEIEALAARLVPGHSD